MLPTTTDTAFLRTILDAPDDDAPRLVYADWLDEQGEADRAEFIRLQIRQARMAPDDPDGRAVRSRVDDLRQRHFVEWVNELPQFDEVHWEVPHRGFMSVVRFESPDAFFAHAREVFRAAPIREVWLHQFNWTHMARLAATQELRQVRVLDFNEGNHIANLGTEALMASPHLANLTELKLAKNSLGSAGVRAIAHSSHVRKLRLLRLDRNDLYDEGLRYLAVSPAVRQLEVLDLNLTRTGDDAVKALARSRYLTRLRFLDLSDNPITDGGVLALAGSTVLANVRDLYLHRTQITDAAAAAIADSPQSARLERVHLRDTRIRDEGALALARSPHLGRLGELFLGGNRISDQAGDELRARFRGGVNLY